MLNISKERKERKLISPKNYKQTKQRKSPPAKKCLAPLKRHLNEPTLYFRVKFRGIGVRLCFGGVISVIPIM